MIESSTEFDVDESFSIKISKFSSKIDSVEDTTFGIIVGSIYSSFLQAYSNQKQNVNSEDIQEFTEIIMMNARIIKDAIIGKNS